MKEMIFWGATGQAKVLRECMRDCMLKLVALFDNNRNLASPFSDVPLYFGKEGFETWMGRRTSKGPVGFFVAIGGDKGRDRIEIQEYLESYGLIPLIAKHATAFVADTVQVGAGAQILANSAIGVETIIGRGCIVNTGATVDHECRLGEGVHIAPGAHLAGNVEIDAYAMVATGAVILPRIKIGEGAIVGAGAVVIKDVSPYAVVAGNPAKVIREIKEIRGKK